MGRLQSRLNFHSELEQLRPAHIRPLEIDVDYSII